MFICKNKPNIGKICQIRRTVNLFEDKNADLRVSTWGDGWKFDAPHVKVSSNPTLFITGFDHGERQRLEMRGVSAGQRLTRVKFHPKCLRTGIKVAVIRPNSTMALRFLLTFC
jgi:hypothetical protein